MGGATAERAGGHRGTCGRQLGRARGPAARGRMQPTAWARAAGGAGRRCRGAEEWVGAGRWRGRGEGARGGARWWARAAARPRRVRSAREGRAGCGAAAVVAEAASCGGGGGVLWRRRRAVEASAGCVCVCHTHRHNQDKVRVRPFAERQILERSAKVRY